MAFQFGAFQSNAFQDTNPAPTPAPDDGTVHWLPFEAYLNGPGDRERVAEEVRQERIRLGILPPDAKPQAVLEIVAKEAMVKDYTEQLQFFRLKAELEAIGQALNADYIERFTLAMQALQTREALRQHQAMVDERQAIAMQLVFMKMLDEEEALLVLLLSC